MLSLAISAVGEALPFQEPYQLLEKFLFRPGRVFPSSVVLAGRFGLDAFVLKGALLGPFCVPFVPTLSVRSAGS